MVRSGNAPSEATCDMSLKRPAAREMGRREKSIEWEALSQAGRCSTVGEAITALTSWVSTEIHIHFF